MKNQLLNGFYLHDVLVEPVNGQVHRNGEATHLPPRATEVLLCLAANPRSLVARQDILDKVWGDGIGSQEALSHAIAEIRHALGDHAADPEFIQTVPKRGYRLLVEPLHRGAEADPQPGDVPPAGHPLPPRGDLPLWQALVRHGVVQAGAAYLVFGWLLIQVADVTFDNLGLPPWAAPLVTYTVLGGFPIVVLLAWFLEFADGRLVRDRGNQRAGIFSGLERNYLAIVAAYAIAFLVAVAYQDFVGFEVRQTAPSAAGGEQPAPKEEDNLIPVAANSVAVLRLLNMGGSETTEIFRNGLSEDLLDRLARVPGLLVPSRGDSWSLPDNASSPLVRRRLRVAYYLEGSVRIAGDEIRVIAQLIDSATGFHLLSRSFTHGTEDFAELQQEITELIVANLRPALPEDIQQLPSAPEADAEFDVYLNYRRGRDVLNAPRTRDTIAAAIDHFRQALSLDADYAAAHAGLCVAYTSLYGVDGSRDDMASAENACVAAVRAGPRLPLAQHALGQFYLATGKLAEAERAFVQALDVHPRDATALLGLARVYRQQSRAEEAESLTRTAIDLQPGNWRTINSLGALLFEQGRYDEAAEQYRKVAYLDPDNFVALGNLGSSYMMSGDFEQSREALERSLAIEDNAIFASNLGIIQYYLGNFAAAARIHRRTVERDPESLEGWHALADSLHFAGERDASFTAFRRLADIARARLEVNPIDPVTLSSLAWAQAMLGNLDDASMLVERVIEAAPEDPYSHYFRALVETRAGRLDAAIGAVRAALDRGYPPEMLVAEPHLQPLKALDAFPGTANLQGDRR